RRRSSGARRCAMGRARRTRASGDEGASPPGPRSPRTHRDHRGGGGRGVGRRDRSTHRHPVPRRKSVAHRGPMSARDGARPGELRASPTVHRVRSMLLPASRRPPKRAVGRARGAWYSRLAESLRRGWIALAWALWLASSNVHAAAGDPRDWTVDLATQQRQLGRVELRYEPHLEGGAAMLAKNIPQWWSQIEQDLALDLPDDLRIIYVDHAGRVADASGMPRWVAGVARPATGEIMIARHGPDGAPTDLRALVRHEMAHVALYRASGGAAVPRWFNEGIAESFENNVDLARFEMLGNLVFGRGVPALDGLEAQFRGADGLDAAGAYAAARDLSQLMRLYDTAGGARPPG